MNIDTFPIIFTDLDGTLLDHDDYSFGPAVRCLKQLRQKRIPVVPVTSKTLQEVIAIRIELELRDAFAVENGGAVYLPREKFDQAVASLPAYRCTRIDTMRESFFKVALSRPRDHWRSLLEQVSTPKSSFICFSELGNKGIADATGLTMKRARMANQREFGEPVLWRGGDAEKRVFVQELIGRGAKVLEGGRFLHVTDPRAGKGRAVEIVLQMYQRLCPTRRPHSIGLGDSTSDLEMLGVVDTPCLIRSPAHALPKFQHDGLLVSRSFGPGGWAEVLTNQLQLSG